PPPPGHVAPPVRSPVPDRLPRMPTQRGGRLLAEPPIRREGQMQPTTLGRPPNILEVVEDVPPAHTLLGDLPYTATVTAREVLPRGDARHVEVTKGSRQPIAVCDLGPVPLLSQLPPELPIDQLGEVPLPLLLLSMPDLLVRPDADRHLSPYTLRNVRVLRHSSHPAVPAPRRRLLSWSSRPLTPLPARTPRATRSMS